MSGNTACIFCIPLKAGKIGKIEGMDKIVKEVNLDSFIQYYKENDIVNEKDIGSLKQLFGRFKFSAHSINNIVDIIDFIQGNLTIYNIDGEPMIFKVSTQTEFLLIIYSNL